MDVGEAVVERKATILMLHGWAQSGWILRHRTEKMRKRLRSAGYETLYLDAPHHLPLKSHADVDGKLGGAAHAGGRKNARCWFFYSSEDMCDASRSLEQVEYLGLAESVSRVVDTLSQIEGNIAILGFSQGATFCHILSSMGAATATTDEGRGLQALRKIKCSIMFSGFESQHESGESRCTAPSHRKIDIKSLHVIGASDTSVPRKYGENLVKRFNEPECYVHAGGHVIPQNLDCSKRIVAFLDGVFRR